MDIEKYMNRYGRKLYLFCSEGKKIQEKHCFLNPLRYKNKMYLEGVPTDIGMDDSGYFLMIAPASIKLAEIGDEGYLCDGEKRFQVTRWEKIWFGENVLYIWAVVKEHTKGKYPYYNHFTERR